MDQPVLWKLILTLGLWVGIAAMQTLMGRNDQKAWSIDAWRVFAAWLTVAAVPMAIFGGWLLVSSNAPPIVLVLIASGALWIAGWKWGASLPVVGRWVKVLQAREAERADKGIL